MDAGFWFIVVIECACIKYFFLHLFSRQVFPFSIFIFFHLIFSSIVLYPFINFILASCFAFLSLPFLWSSCLSCFSPVFLSYFDPFLYPFLFFHFLFIISYPFLSLPFLSYPFISFPFLFLSFYFDFPVPFLCLSFSFPFFLCKSSTSILFCHVLTFPANTSIQYWLVCGWYACFSLEWQLNNTNPIKRMTQTGKF